MTPLGGWDTSNGTCIHHAAEQAHLQELSKVVLNATGIRHRSLRWLPFNIHTASKQLVANLKSFQLTTAYSTEPSDMHELVVSTHELENLTTSVAISYSSKMDDAERQIEAQYYNDIAKSSTKVLCTAAKRELSLHGLSATHRDDTNTALRTRIRPASPWMVVIRVARTANHRRRPLERRSTNDEAWVEQFAVLLQIVSSAASELLGLNAGKSTLPDGLKKSRFMISLRDKRLEDRIQHVERDLAEEDGGFEMALADTLMISVVANNDEEQSVGGDAV
ncbi:hypothetical protein D9613_011921 [Agrocybe pediades]|uniref:Uncharacterized protein n=1 Tax=Agrocybe pediades TaxID=84607 RepID=A0A8H4QEQ9_9AGAR|nr:hypothetical protein D9613_011921 [Agrocybe pediades]